MTYLLHRRLRRHADEVTVDFPHGAPVEEEPLLTARLRASFYLTPAATCCRAAAAAAAGLVAKQMIYLCCWIQTRPLTVPVEASGVSSCDVRAPPPLTPPLCMFRRGWKVGRQTSLTSSSAEPGNDLISQFDRIREQSDEKM